MFSHPLLALMIAKEQIADLERQAEAARLVRNSTTGFPRRLLSGLGAAMVKVGSRLETYGSPQRGSDCCPEVVS